MRSPSTPIVSEPAQEAKSFRERLIATDLDSDLVLIDCRLRANCAATRTDRGQRTAV